MLIAVTFNQNRRLAFEQAMRANGRSYPSYNICTGFRFEVSKDAKALEGILDSIVRRHSTLRASFMLAPERSEADRSTALDTFLRTGICPPGIYGQTIHEDARITIVADPRELSDIGTSLDRIAHELSAASFEYEQPPLVRARLFAIADGSQLLLVVLPHLICDRRSLEVLTEELTRQVQSGTNEPRQFRNETQEWPLDAALEREAQRSGELAAAADYWLGRWDEFEAAQIERAHMPFALPILRAPAGAVASERMTLDERLAQRLKTFAKSNRITLYMLYLAGISRLLRQVLGVNRVVIWSNLPNRVAPGSESAIGWFVNSHILGIDLSAATSARALLDQVRRVVSEALDHQHLPLGLLWYQRQRCPIRGIRIGLDMTDHAQEIPGTATGVKRIGVASGQHGMIDLNFEVHVNPQTIVLVATYSVDLLVAYTVRQLLTRLRRVLDDIVNEQQREYVIAH